MSETKPRPLSERRLLVELRAFLRDRFNLHDDQASEQETIEEIKKGVVFRGANVWILMFAIMVCSVGLNVNSTAVVIGAMLISPLMGPIMGIGLGVGTNDSDLIIKALKNLAIMAGVSILTSALYFLITPLDEAQSELLARTTPTLWDVLIAFFGGLAGIVAGSRKEKSNAIPGVAIATALMPPLCTAGYGLGTGQFQYFIGAFYLFFINSVFISLATFLIVRALNYPRKEFMDHAREQRVKRYIAIFAILTVIPSFFTAYNVVRESVFQRKANLFVSSEFRLGRMQVINRQITLKGGKRTIEVTLLGEPLNPDMENMIRASLLRPEYNLKNTELIIHQGYQDQGLDIDAVEQMNRQLRVGIIEDLYKRNEEALRNKDAQILLLEEEIVRLRARDLPILDLAREIKAINDNVEEFSIATTVIAQFDSLKSDTLFLAFVNFKRRPRTAEITQIRNFLKARTQADSLRLVTE